LIALVLVTDPAHLCAQKSNYDITHIMSRWANVLIGCVAALTAIVLIVDTTSASRAARI
jgi:hypothetical protein